MADFINIETKGFEQLQRQFKASPPRMQKLTARAATTAARAANTSLRRLLAPKIGVTQRVLRGRFYVSSAKDARFASLWIGLNPLEAAQIHRTRRGNVPSFRNVSEDAAGAFANDYFFPDAFVLPSRRTGDTVFKRVGEGRGALEMQRVAVDRPDTRADIERVAEVAELLYLNETYRHLNVDWDKAAARSRAS